MRIVPDYTFDDAPTPQIIVIPAQRWGLRTNDRLDQAHGRTRARRHVRLHRGFVLAKTGS